MENKVENRKIEYDKLKHILKDRGIRVSHQRLLILDYLISTDTHPSAESIFHNLKSLDPVISQATVYNTLNLFVEKHLVRELDFNMPSKHYEYLDESHGHFICKSCNSITDFELNNYPVSNEIKNFNIHSIDVIYRGICPECKKRGCCKSPSIEKRRGN